eukprot:1972202-Pyramimonas_sp.AAC.1
MGVTSDAGPLPCQGAATQDHEEGQEPPGPHLVGGDAGSLGQLRRPSTVAQLEDSTVAGLEAWQGHV